MEKLINVYSIDYLMHFEFLGQDTLANFEAVRDEHTYASGNSLCRGAFGIYGHEDHIFMAVLV